MSKTESPDIETFPGSPREKEVTGDPNLDAEEKETTLTVDNTRGMVRIHSDIPTHIKWVLSIPESEIQNVRYVSDKVCGITADVPKGMIKLQSTSRKSQTNGGMVSYGDLL